MAQQFGADAELKVVEDLADQFEYDDAGNDERLIEDRNRGTRTRTGLDFRGNPKYDVSTLQRNRYQQLFDEDAERFRTSIRGFDFDTEEEEEPTPRSSLAPEVLDQILISGLAPDFFKQELDEFLNEELTRIAERELRIDERMPPPPYTGEAGGKGDDPVMRPDMDALIFDPVKQEYTGAVVKQGPRGVVEQAFVDKYGLSGILDIMNLEQREKGRPYAIPDEEGRKVSVFMLKKLLQLEGVLTTKSRDRANETARKVGLNTIPEGMNPSNRDAYEQILFGRRVGSTEEYRAERGGRGVGRLRYNKKFYKDFYKKLNDYHQSNK